MKKEQFVIDNETYVLSKDKNKKNVTNKQIHDIILLIFLEIDRICRKNNIPYALSFGSALGLYNYGGFIPWDDDGDIVIDYFDYPHLVESLKNDLGEQFAFECYEVNHKYNALIPPIKVRFKGSYCKERNHIFLPNRANISNGLFVDICTFMGVPENKKEHQKLINKNFMRMIPYVFFDALLGITPKKLQRKIKNDEEKNAKKYIDSDYVSQTTRIPFQAHPKKIVKNLSFPKNVIYPFKEYDFIGHKLFSFCNIEEFCRLRYGEESLKKFRYNQYIDEYRNKHKIKAHHFLEIDIF